MIKSQHNVENSASNLDPHPRQVRLGHYVTVYIYPAIDLVDSPGHCSNPTASASVAHISNCHHHRIHLGIPVIRPVKTKTHLLKGFVCLLKITCQINHSPCHRSRIVDVKSSFRTDIGDIISYRH